MKKIYINPQSKGGLGKSFETECRIAWLDAIGVQWKGYDLDDRHHTFADRHPSKVQLVNLDDGSKDVLLGVFFEVFQSSEPVIVIDTRAQADRLILEAFTQLRIFERAEEENSRFVISLFPTDDNESMENLRSIIQWGARKADYVIIRNKIRARSIMFDQSSMQRTLIDKLDAKEINIPSITTTSIQALEKVEREERKSIGFNEFASGWKGVDPLITGEYAYLLGQMASQYNEISSFLLPETELGKVVKCKSTSALKTIEKLDLSI